MGTAGTGTTGGAFANATCSADAAWATAGEATGSDFPQAASATAQVKKMATVLATDINTLRSIQEN
jgi:hypothetical protein